QAHEHVPRVIDVFPRPPMSQNPLSEPGRHRLPDLALLVSCGGKQTLQFHVITIHISPSFSSCANNVFNFFRARKARTLITAAFQPVIFLISATLRSSRCSNRITMRSRGGKAV